MNNAFVQYVFSGLSFRAYAARFGVPVPTLLRAITGFGDLPPELADPNEVQKTLNPNPSEFLYMAMKGPRGSVRWHQWAVARDVGLAILNDEDEFRKARKEPGRIYIFTTTDNLVVAINPQHIVTAMFGGEDTHFFVEQKALIPMQLVSGDSYVPANQTKVLQEVHEQLRQAAEKLDGLTTEDPQVWLDLPGYSDVRPSLAYLRDLKAPFEDNLWDAGTISAQRVIQNNKTICSQLDSAIHVDEEIYLPTSAAIVDHDGMKAHVLLPLDQTSVLQASRWTIERTSLERTRTLVEGVGEGDGRLTAQMIQNDCRALGLFGVDEIEEYVAGFIEALGKSVAAAPPKKRRGRPRKVVEGL